MSARPDDAAQAVQSGLISASDLSDLLGQPRLKLFDVRGTWQSPARAIPEAYQEGHIPGAVFVDWTKEFLEQGVELSLASIANLDEARRSFERLGINAGDTVVIYDDYHHMFAGRIWWAMRYWGFAQVWVLDGGFPNWLAEGRPVTSEPTEAALGTFMPQERASLRIGLEDFIARHRELQVLDARGPNSYAGKPDDPRTGHIPGVVHIPFRSLLDEKTGVFRDVEAIEKVFDEAFSAWREQPLISSCGAGYSATVAMLALSKLSVSSPLFDGSFAAWKQDPTRPVEQSLDTR